jgi:Domain of unknown function (DUF4387)
MRRIRDLAQISKSKNAGPFALTIDVVFADPAVFDKVKHTRVLGPVCPALRGASRGCAVHGLRRTLAFRATLPRLVPAGDIGDTDVYGAQQHAPLLDVDIPI